LEVVSKYNHSRPSPGTDHGTSIAKLAPGRRDQTAGLASSDHTRSGRAFTIRDRSTCTVDSRIE
jgi:antitoxin (DNA-binding transcriptional repressor) of toxin-antitoxin stability system